MKNQQLETFYRLLQYDVARLRATAAYLHFVIDTYGAKQKIVASGCHFGEAGKCLKRFNRKPFIIP